MDFGSNGWNLDGLIGVLWLVMAWRDFSVIGSKFWAGGIQRLLSLEMEMERDGVEFTHDGCEQEEGCDWLLNYLNGSIISLFVCRYQATNEWTRRRRPISHQNMFGRPWSLFRHVPT